MSKWHFGGRLCAQCEHARVLHRGCAHTGTNFRLRSEKQDGEAKSDKARGRDDGTS